MDPSGFRSFIPNWSTFCGDWLHLKILEITPELTQLGNTLAEALELQKAHDEVLRQLQNKQSPVEELLRQADQLIATQKPRAEVYAAMAESLGRAWKDINSNLELRKHILDLNVEYHRNAQDFFEKMDVLEATCRDATVPIEIDAVKTFLTNIHEQRRAVLESLMGALQAGNNLLGKLKELGAEGTLDSRPDRIRISVNRAISQVQGWMDELHLKRQVLETTFNRRKTQLEQCLALAILASDLRELEETIHQRRELLANSNQLGDSSSSAELLLHEHRKLIPEARQLQERALKITKATEQLVASGCYAGEQATTQSYVVLSTTSDYLTDLQSREQLLERVIAFFRSAQTVITKLDQLEIQLTATELPKTSPQLAQLHAQCARAIEEATAAPIAEGHAILSAVGHGSQGAEGVKRVAEQLENKKIRLQGLCTAHKEENMRVSAALNNFLEKHGELYTWITTIAEAFLQGHQDMGSDLTMAKDFFDLHSQLLTDLQTKGNEINSLLLTLPPILEYLEDNQRKDIDKKVEDLHDRWMRLKNILESRMELSRIYVKFHTEADLVSKGMDRLEDSIRVNKDKIDDKTMAYIEEQFDSLVPLYQSAKNTGLTFINEARRTVHPHLDVRRAATCVESTLERLAGRQLTATRSWCTHKEEILEKRETFVKLEVEMAESSKTISWVTKLDSQLYPVITTASTKPSEIVEHIENKLSVVVPDIKKAQAEVDQRIKSAEALMLKAPTSDEKTLNIKNKLYDLNQKLIEISSEYQILLQVLIGYFKNLDEIDKKAETYHQYLDKSGYPKDLSSTENVIREYESARQTIVERLRFAQTECDQISQRIRQQEPEAAAEQDTNKLQHVLELRRAEFESQWRRRHDSLESHRQLCVFDSELKQINSSIEEISRQVRNVKGQYGESVPSAKAVSQTFNNVEQSMESLERRIQTLVKTGEKLLAECHAQSPYVQSQLSGLQDRWNNLKNQAKTVRSLMDMSVPYFQLVDEADEWFKEGSKLLVTIARKSTTVRQPQEAEHLLSEVTNFLRPGEAKQSERITKISELAHQLYGPDQSKYAPVLSGNKEMIESFNTITKELRTLADNLRTAEEEKEKMKREQEEAKRIEEERKRREAELAEQKRLEEEARRVEEARIAAEKRKAEEARLAEEARIAQEKIKAEELRIAEEMKRVEVQRLAEEARLAEERRKAEEAKQAEEQRLAEERRKLEEEKRRLELERRQAEAKSAEEARQIELKRKQEEARLAELRRAEEARLEAERKRAEDDRRKAEEERRRAEEERRHAEEASRQAEEKRIHEERILIEQRKLEEIRILEFRKQEESKLAEQRKLDEQKFAAQIKAEEAKLQEQIKAEQSRLAEQRKAEEARISEQRKAEEARLAELRRKEEEARLSELKRIEEARLEEERRKIEIERKKVEEERKKVEEEKKKAEEERQRAEQARLMEEQKRIDRIEITEITDVKTEMLLTSKRVPSPLPIVEDAAEAPIFTSPLSDAVIQEGSKFTFVCQVSGQPKPTVTWYKAGISIQNNPDYHTTFDDGICSLTIEETFAEDSARYTCRAHNAAGDAETTAHLSVKESEPEEILTPPSFTKTLQPEVAKENSSFQFECKVTGNPLPTVQWFKNGECIDNSPDYTITYNNGDAVLRFEKVGLGDKAEYTCKAVNQLGMAQSTANLVVTPLEPTEAPRFIVPLSNVMARAGQKIKLECEVSGVPLPTLAWSHDGKPVRETRELKLHQEGPKATLIVFEAFPKDAGTYTVAASNIAGEAASSSSVSVKGRLPTETSDSEMASDLEPIKPSIQLPLSNTTVKEGQRIRLDCVIVGQPEPEVIWYHDNRPVKESTDIQLLFQGDRCSLVIQEALPEDAGEYKVVALNSAGEASSRCILSVTPLSDTEADGKAKEGEEKKGTTGSPPKFTKLLADVLVSEGDKVVLEGNVTGEPKPDIKWLLNNLPITDTQHFSCTHDDEGNVKLEIAHVRPEDKGVYTVKASNTHGDAKCFAQLIVKSLKPPETVEYEEIKVPPEFKEKFSDIVAFEDTATKFECIVTGKPTPKVKWLFNGDAISGKDFLISTSADRQVLSIPNLKKEHSGTLTCVAENEAGKASCAASLTVQPASSTALPELKLIPDIVSPLKTEQTQHVESSYTINREVVTKSSTSQSSKIIASDAEPHIEEHKIISQNAQTYKKVNQDAPEIKESHKIEEFHKVGQQPPIITEQSSTTYVVGEKKDMQSRTTSSESQELIQKPIPKIRPPKFVTPVIGKIVDQLVDVVLEGILDGQPTPNIKWTKNGEELKETDRIKIKWDKNRTAVEIKNITAEDAGRYSCTATNDGGTAVSTADLVVRKTIFPPVFGRRLQAQVIKKGDRIVMEVEVTGTPEPTITWYKDSIPVKECLKDAKVKSLGQSHTLVIEKADLGHTGRFMVRATNAGGEAQSIADIAVYEPTPDTMVEVVKTVVFEDVRKHETLTSSADKISSTITTPTPIPVEIPKVEILPSAVTSSETSQSAMFKSEYGTTTEQKSSKEFQQFKLEHTTPEILMPKPLDTTSIIERHTDFQIYHSEPRSQHETIEEKKIEVQDGIETSSISKESSLQYFVKKMTEGDSVVQKEVTVPEPIKPEIFEKFESFTKESESTGLPKVPPPIPPKPPKTTEIIKDFKSYTLPETQEYKTFSQEITREYSTTPTKPEFKPFQPIIAPPEYKPFPPQVVQDFDLKPEPPAEICYAPKQPGMSRKREDMSEKIRRISESQKELSAHEVPTGAIRIFPPAPKFEPKKETVEKTEQSFQSSSFQTSSLSQSYESSAKTSYDKMWTPQLERPTSSASSAYSGRPLSAQSGGIEPSTEGVQMEKQWAHKFSETHMEKSWPPMQQDEPKYEPSWSVQSTLERKWTPAETKTETIHKEIRSTSTGVPTQHYIGEVTDLQHKIQSDSYSKREFYEKEEKFAKPSEIIKSWPPAPVYTETQRTYTSIDSLPIRPVSVQDITDEVILEPGPPPEIGYAEPPRQQRRRSYVETVEQEIEKSLAPSKVPPCSVRTIPPPRDWVAPPPPLPPKQMMPQAPPLPAKPVKHVEPPKKIIESVPLEKFPELEPFPFKPGTEKPKGPKVGPPPTPSKFIKGKFTDSDYESDIEAVKITPKWKPCMSDTEESTGYRRVRPPQPVQSGRSRSTEPEPLPPSQFEHPPELQGPPRPQVRFEDNLQDTQTKKFTKHVRAQDFRKVEVPQAPVYIPVSRKPESPKAKRKTFQDGYMADTEYTTEYSSKEERSEYRQFKSSEYSSQQQSFTSKSSRQPKFPVKKHQTVSTAKKEFVATPIVTSQTTQQMYEQHDKHVTLEPFPFKPEPPVQIRKPKGPPPPSPSKFVKGEFKESDYESDYEGRIPPVWKSVTEPAYKPVRPVLTPSQHHQQYGRTPTPPTEFDNPPRIEGPPRPKFEPIDKVKSEPKKPVVFKPKPISAAPITDMIIAKPAQEPILLKPGTPPEIVYSPGPKKTQYYRSTVTAPYTNAVQTETSNVVHFDESTETGHRKVCVQQTHKVIKFGDQYRNDQKLEPFPFQAEPDRGMRSNSVPPPPTPSRFIPGDFRESDYESEVESTRIKPKWTPHGADEHLQYRRVRGPTGSRSSSVPAPKERILSPMEFDAQPPVISTHVTRDMMDGESRRHESSYQKFMDKRSNQIVHQRSRSYEPALQPGSPPEYGYAKDQRMIKSTAIKAATHHMDSMTKDFKSKTQKFVSDVVGDMNKQARKPILKKPADTDAQIWREETRASQHGTKHVDPDTGLIYFKYDFGYEFGIILPGEGKQKGGEINFPKKTVIEPPKRTRDIEMPVYHEKSPSQAPTPQFKPKKFTKWEPTSESEMSEYEMDRKHQGSRWEPSSCSPVSLSPSLPSTSPAFNNTFAGRKGAESPPSCPSTPGSTRVILQPGQARAPMFITPLRDIAVTAGQAAKFECIVQSEPPPSTLWSKNGRIIEHSNDYQIHYRNGVCRLTVTQAYPEDAGTYTCTATNPAGTANTSATLQVPGERRSQYLK
ncbi:unnamed protein product [Acanthoscelides obtectus]|uniref:Ig-like domain-containing protein n=1 Tax=Acanthoscelides obtectus TaxID=200917 RepID=A0A9P0P9G7_ACAOB|nr:unnamed protein product [Acanthoscelides obtectus]CAK1646371.1 Muscle M-line assembly protein unc-89 [Acanthoscelides obtectus]